ncbi:MAG: amino acid adenylation domain-containing protein, partial [Polyangiaceae bacterium]
LFEHAQVRSPARRAEKLAIPLDARLEGDVFRLAKEHETTPFIVLFAAFSTLLYRHTGRRDVRIGVPAANRRLTETEGLIGLFVNTQVLRVEVDGSSTFAEIVERTKNASLEAQAHQDLPFERLVEAIHPTRRLGQTPLFQVLCNFQKRETGALRALPGLTIEMFDRPPVAAQFDLAFDGEQSDAGELRAVLRYAADVFDFATVERLATHFVHVLDEVLSDPAQRIADVEMLTHEERGALRRLDATERTWGVDLFVHHAIAAQARATPEATALLFGAEQLTHGELDRRANRLAHGLRARGVGAGVVVGIMLERSFEMVVSILAVLKAGGAYLPVDPDLPAARIAYILSDSDARIVVTSANLSLPHALPDGVRVVRADDANIVAESEVAPAVQLSKDDIAYVIYTSGSTGHPKGAANTHAGLSNRLRWMQDAYRLEPAETVLQKTPFSFDVSVWELLWPLMVGARMRLAEPGAHRDPSRLVDLIAGDGISTVHFVPSMLDAFLESERVERCTSLRRIVASGEALRADTVARVASRLPEARLFNLSGPTEASIDVTHWSCVPSADHLPVPIGVPIANTVIRILDTDLNEVPAGVAGELHIGGVGLAREYWRNPALTAERFIPDPWSREAGTRLYRTGDRARRRTDGSFEYLGRFDDQVKVRGFRVELGEIESALVREEGVEQAVAAIRKDDLGGRIVAYVVAKRPFAGSLGTELKRRLAETLPEYMVPSSIVVLDALPRLPSGKIDRKALPDGEASRAERIAPEKPIEIAIAAIWQSLLGVERVGRQDDFFELGGHSLLAIRLVARTKEQLGVAIPLETVFRATTLERFSDEVERAGSRTITDEKMQKLDALLTELEDA